jgi:DNA/RNA endonuclease G (NUC1)
MANFPGLAAFLLLLQQNTSNSGSQMRFRPTSVALGLLAFVAVSCSENDITGPGQSSIKPRTDIVTTAAVPLPPIRISEFHYDNAGTDSAEKVEISYPTGTNLTGWRIILVNGNGGANYRTTLVTTGAAGAACGDRSVTVVSYAANGIENGSPDGIALMRADSTIADFISYEGITVATASPVAGTVSRDIGIDEPGTTPLNQSLQMDSEGTWTGPTTSTFGTCNDNGAVAPGNVVTSVAVNPSASTGLVGSPVTFAAVASGSSGDIEGARINWTSTNPAVATVNVNGVATGVSLGSTQIIATATNGTADTASLTVVAPPPTPVTRFSELHYDNTGADINEAIEIEGPGGTDLTGWSVVLYNGNGGVVYDTRALSGTIPTMCNGRGVVYLIYNPDGIQNGAPDGLALIDNTGAVVEFLSYEGTVNATDGPANGTTSFDIVVSQNGAPIGQSLSRNALGLWSAGAATIGGCNSGVGPAPPAPANAITVSGRDLGDDGPLPVGFEDQLFATLRSGATGATIASGFTWTSETPSIATIDGDGVMHALSAGTAIFRVTADDATTRTYSFPMYVATAGTTASYQDHTEFGVPTDSNPTDDFIINRTEYKSSFSVERGIPNWVSYNLDASHFGGQDRCDCFTFDPELPQDARYTTADYTGAGAFHGYGIDRGHLARSFDRTSGSLDNARTFYFSNIFPQAGLFNRGTWGGLETDLGNLARFGNKELFIITGVSGSIGTVKNEGIITIPEYVWKVAVVLPQDQGLSSIDSFDDLEVIAVAMRNDSLVSGDWENYEVSVDSVEKLSGYDLLALLPDYIEVAVESEAVAAFLFIDGLVTNGTITADVGISLKDKLNAAINAIARGQNEAASKQLTALSKQIDALVVSGRLTPTQANELRALLEGLIAAASA